MKKFFLSILFFSSLFGANAEYFIKDRNFRATSDYFDNHSQYLYFMKLYVNSSFSVESGDEIGIFVGNSSNSEYGVLIGSFKIESTNIKDGKANEIDIVCFKSSTTDVSLKDGAFSGDTIYYKFYDKSEGAVYKALSATNVTFSEGGLVSPSFKNATIALGTKLEDVSILSLSATSKSFVLGVSGSYDVLISGGLAPYSATYDINIVNVVINSNILNITPLSTGSTQIIVSDSASTQKTINVSVSVEPFSISSNAVEFDLSAITSKEITISGGVKPYSISSISNNIVTTNLNNNKLNITPTALGSTFITLTDAMANSQIVAITVVNSSNSSNNAGNNAPIISQINFSANEVLESGSVTINVIASDSDGDLITTICSTQEGSVTNLNNISTFRAPFVSSDKYVEITCFASDSKITTSKTASIKVKDIPTTNQNNDSSNNSNNNSSNSSNTVNYPPNISQIYSGFSEVNENSSISVLVIASDANGDDLNYSCMSNFGEVKPLNQNSITFLAPSVSLDKNVTITCSVSDGNSVVYKTKELKIKNIDNLNTSTDGTNSNINEDNIIDNEQNNFYIDIVYNIKSGWNLIGNSSNKEIDKEFFEDTFSKNVQMYSFNNGWVSFSNGDKVTILPRQGFWLKSLSLKDYNVTLYSNGDGSAEFLTPKSGWSLMAIMNNTTLIKIKNSLNATKVWRYDNISKNWFNAVENPNHNLKVGDGYWVFLP